MRLHETMGWLNPLVTESKPEAKASMQSPGPCCASKARNWTRSNLRSNLISKIIRKQPATNALTRQPERSTKAHDLHKWSRRKDHATAANTRLVRAVTRLGLGRALILLLGAGNGTGTPFCSISGLLSSGSSGCIAGLLRKRST